jgi:hypothetical protein
VSLQNDRPYLVVGNSQSDQAERSTVNPGASRVEDRILIELQTIAVILHMGFGITESLGQIRADVAASIT